MPKSTPRPKAAAPINSDRASWPVPTSQLLSLCRLPEVIQITGLSRASIYQRMAAGEFPLSIQLGPMSIAWERNEINDWIKAQIARSRSSQPAPKTKLPKNNNGTYTHRAAEQVDQTA